MENHLLVRYAILVRLQAIAYEGEIRIVFLFSSYAHITINSILLQKKKKKNFDFFYADFT